MAGVACFLRRLLWRVRVACVQVRLEVRAIAARCWITLIYRLLVACGLFWLVPVPELWFVHLGVSGPTTVPGCDDVEEIAVVADG